MSLATPNKIRTLQRKLYRKAKEEPACGSPVSLAVNPVRKSRMRETRTSGSMSGDGKRRNA